MSGAHSLLIVVTLTACMNAAALPPSANESGSAALAAYAKATSESADTHILGVTPITRVYADGWKVGAVAVEYDRAITGASLAPGDYMVKTEVPGQKITGIYTTDDGDYYTKGGKGGKSGKYVVLELSTDYLIPVNPARAPVAPTPPPAPRPSNQAGGPGSPSAPPAHEKVDFKLNAEVVSKVGSVSWDPVPHPGTLLAAGKGGNGKTVSVQQLGDVKSVDGMTFTATSAAKENFYSRNLIVDGFLKPDYNDGTDGNLKYNIHFPEHFDPSRKYPVVVFITDTDSVSHMVHAETLTQGLGAVVWADKKQEEKDPAIVVAPLPMNPLLDDKYEPVVRQSPRGTSRAYAAVLSLMDHLVEDFPNIDKQRIYLTGQGNGASTALRMMSDRPDFFAAALLFAPAYDPAKAAKLAKAKMWIVTSEGDANSYPAMQASIENLHAAGAQIAKTTWSGQQSPTQFASDVRSTEVQGKAIEYTVLKKGTVVPAGVPDDDLNNHAYTWRIGYSNPELRNWLLQQRR